MYNFDAMFDHDRTTKEKDDHKNKFANDADYKKSFTEWIKQNAKKQQENRMKGIIK